MLLFAVTEFVPVTDAKNISLSKNCCRALDRLQDAVST